MVTLKVELFSLFAQRVVYYFLCSTKCVRNLIAAVVFLMFFKLSLLGIYFELCILNV